MKICFSINNISLCGGTERMCLIIANELSKCGYDVCILSMQGSYTTFFHKEEKVKIHRNMNNLEMKFMGTHPKYMIFKYRLWYWFIHPDVIIDCDLLMSNLTIPAIKGLGIKHVAWDNFSYEYFKMVHFEHVALKKIKDFGSYMVTLTKKDRELYISEQGVSVDKIFQIYNPLTFNIYHRTSHFSKKVISIGRFSHEKGFDLLLKAWKIVEDSGSDWTLEIWGNTGEDTGNVYATYKKLNLINVSLNPATNNVQEKLMSSSIYVLPSRHEGLGLVLLEASACSLPLIAFDCPNGPREIIQDEYNGLLVESGNVKALANAILRLINDKALREIMGKNAYVHSNAFRIEKILPMWESLFGYLRQ